MVLSNHLKEFNIFAIGPFQLLAENDIDEKIKIQAGELTQTLLDMNILDNVWDKIINSDVGDIYSIVAALTHINDEKATAILDKLIFYPLLFEGIIEDFEDVAEIKSFALYFFMDKFSCCGVYG